jgi:hypothetical protein
MHQRAVNLFDRMLRLQVTGGSEALANGADRQGGIVQHAEGGIAERVNPLGMKVLLQQTANNLPNLVEGELLPDNHRIPDSVLPAARFGG